MPTAGKLKGQVALVTGGAVRIGAAIARSLAGAGADVIIHYRSSAEEADALSSELRGLGVRAWHIRADLDKEAACGKLMEEAFAVAGHVDLLVNCAAVFHKDALRALTSEKILAQFRPNLFAPMFLTKALAAKTSKGCVINLLDRRIAGHDASCIPYLLSKKALAEFTQLAALELAPGIRVNGVAPGPILPPPGEGKAYLKDKGGRVPLETDFSPEDIADAVLFLAAHAKVTGQIIFVDGGQHLLGEI